MKLGEGQKFVLIMCGVAIVAMFIFPPWIFIGHDAFGQVSRIPAGYHPLFDPPKDNVRVDVIRLGLQFAIAGFVIASTFAVSLIWRDDDHRK